MKPYKINKIKHSEWIINITKKTHRINTLENVDRKSNNDINMNNKLANISREQDSIMTKQIIKHILKLQK